MPFLTKKTKAKIAKQSADNAAEFAKIINGVKYEIEATDRVMDAGERYLVLADIENKISGLVKEAEQEVAGQVGQLNRPMKTAGGVLRGTGGGTFMAGGILAFAAFTGGIAAVAVGGAAAMGIGLSMIRGGKRLDSDNRIGEMLTGSKDSFCNAMKSLRESLALQRSAIIKNDLPGLAASSHFDDLYDTFPAVKDAFIKASARESVVPNTVRLDKPAYPKRNP